MRIALSTGGGDAPGRNAVIRAAVLSALDRGWEVLGVKRGFAGLLGEDDVVSLTRDSVRGIARLGVTILGTTNRGNPCKWPRQQADGTYIEVDRLATKEPALRERGIFWSDHEADCRSCTRIDRGCVAAERRRAGLGDEAQDRGARYRIGAGDRASAGGDVPHM